VNSLRDWLTQPEGVATRLRAMRAQAGLSGKQLANANDWEQSKVSRIENGRQMPSPEDIDSWARTCNADDETVRELHRLRDAAQAVQITFRSRMRHGQEPVQESYNELVNRSSLIRHFETAYVPGLLQVPSYARRVLNEMIPLQELDIDDVDAAVAARMRRQQMLYDQEKSFEFLLAEPVLRWQLVPAAVMREQLDRLQTVIGLERVRFGIVPMGAELATTPQNSFQMYMGNEPVVIAETFAREVKETEEPNIARYEHAMNLLWEEAVTGEDARRLIIAATQALGRSEVT
jgi:transcriptional regulator with XRE-family HTH domain